ncbi:MAG TPA: hypothetical protein VGC13_09040 [Longimicrobium sp.]|uniref:hypothetical protein n=1 Tax=Longimicrobium sp. TaxID=2029185 RepID=UPI002EDB0FB8
MKQNGFSTLEPENYQMFCTWLQQLAQTGRSSARHGNRKLSFTENQALHTARAILRLFQHGIDREPGWSLAHYRRMQKTLQRTFRGAHRRIRRRTIKKAFPISTFEQVADAVAREVEECRLHLATVGQDQQALPGGRSRYRQSQPFALLAAVLTGILRYGIRAEEANQVNREDVERDPNGHHAIHLRAPNKAHRVLPVDQNFLDVLDTCLPWSEAVRHRDPQAAGDALLVYSSRGKAGKPARYTTKQMERHLDQFCLKWFQRTRTTAEGTEQPILHAVGDAERPLKTTPRDLRRAYSVYTTARLKNNLAAVQEILGHKNIRTTLEQYTLLSEGEYADGVAFALGPEAKLLAAGLKHRVALGIDEASPETIPNGRETPVGTCQADVCRRAASCLDCPSAVILTSRRPVIQQIRDEAVARAQAQTKKSDQRGAENILRRASLAQAVLNQIDHLTRTVV